ncbi:hypothetical protein SUDANB1_05614 [Streptomyces sp. enrichment culture]|uniref:hypothetical protein n=1 Tax=Streptomyces sp. enrichment culture TaxID=1795815 RepID=UPI003F550927
MSVTVNLPITAKELQDGDMLTLFGQLIRVVGTPVETPGQPGILTVYRSGAQFTIPAEQGVIVRRVVEEPAVRRYDFPAGVVLEVNEDATAWTVHHDGEAKEYKTLRGARRRINRLMEIHRVHFGASTRAYEKFEAAEAARTKA